MGSILPCGLRPVRSSAPFRRRLAFFAATVLVPVAAELTLRYKVVVATGEWDIEACARERD